jgi:hypothetical protein
MPEVTSSQQPALLAEVRTVLRLPHSFLFQRIAIQLLTPSRGLTMISTGPGELRFGTSQLETATWPTTPFCMRKKARLPISR